MRQVSNHLLIRMGEEESKLRALVVAQLWKTEWEFAENGASIPGLNLLRHCIHSCKRIGTLGYHRQLQFTFDKSRKGGLNCHYWTGISELKVRGLILSEGREFLNCR